MAVTLILEAQASGARLKPSCELLGVSTHTFHRWRKRGTDLADKRAESAKHRHHEQALTDEEKAAILCIANTRPFEHLPPHQIVAKLADQGVYIASESSFYRVLREHKQLAHRGRAAPARRTACPPALLATGPNRTWSWDITYLPSVIKGQFYRLYMIMDVWSRAIVAWEIHEEERAELAAELITKACLKHGVKRNQIHLHSDNGGPMKGASMLSTLQSLGVIPSFSRPSVSNDNPFSESLFKTLKYVPNYPKKPFESLQAARQWVHGFTHWYNEEHCHSGIKYVAPMVRHRGGDVALLSERDRVYRLAKHRHPNRWKGRATRDWSPIGLVALNPAKSIGQQPMDEKQAA